MRARSTLAALALVAAALGSPRRAAADGKKDFQEGVAAYEDLDTDKAVVKFKSAVKSADVPNADKALAYLYLGMVEFESGREKEAYDWWKKGFALDPNVQPPKGTSPKTISALEAVREEAAASQATPPVGKPPPTVEAPPPGPQVTPPAAPPEEEKKGVPGWVLWGGIGAAAVVGGVLAVVLIAGGGSACQENGGCATIDINIP